MSGKEEVKAGKSNCGLLFSREYKSRWNNFHAEHTMTGSEEMSGGYGWKRD